MLTDANAKPAKLLTAPQATRQVRRHVDRIMPGVMATVESKLSHDLATDTPTVITTVTFPRGHMAGMDLYSALTTIPHRGSIAVSAESFTITRAR